MTPLRTGLNQIVRGALLGISKEVLFLPQFLLGRVALNTISGSKEISGLTLANQHFLDYLIFPGSDQLGHMILEMLPGGMPT
jgi:hypothetical protein